MTVTPFNFTYIALVFLSVIFILASYAIFKNKSEKAKTIFMISLCVFNIAGFFVYKGFLSADKEFLAIKSIDNFNWFDELPLQLCNINMFLIPIGILTKNKFIKGFSFFIAPLGAAMALIFPEPAFVGYSILEPRMLGFYGTHFLVLISGILLAVLDFYRPEFPDMPGITATVFILALGAHGINTLLRVSGLCTFANYFFTYSDGGVSLLMLFRKYIPINFIYELPALLILLSYMAVITGAFEIFGKKRKTFENATSDVSIDE